MMKRPAARHGQSRNRRKKQPQRPVTDSWTTPRYSRQDAETMMCLLDAWRDIEDSSDGEHIDAQGEFFRDFRSNHGSFDLRHMLEQLCFSAEKVWQELGEHESGLTYDWAFCPLFLRHGVNWDAYNGLRCVVPAWDDAAARIKAHIAIYDRFGREQAA